MPLDPQAEEPLKKLADSGTQPFETMTLAEGRPELTVPRSNMVLWQTNVGVAGEALRHLEQLDPLLFAPGEKRYCHVNASQAEIASKYGAVA